MDHGPFTGSAIEVSKLASLVDTPKENSEQIAREEVSFMYGDRVSRESASSIEHDFTADREGV